MVSRNSTPEVRYPDPPPPVPERSDTETQTLAEEQRKRFFGRSGRASTMLTGGSGVDEGSAAVRFLGGAAKT